MAELTVAPDFWLPERLAKLGVFIDLERQTYRKYVAVLDAWTKAIRDPVLRPGGAPGLDPMGVFAGDLVWQEGIERFARSGLMPILRTAYREHFGEDFAFTHRPYVLNHLANVNNRLKGVPNQVFDEIRQELAKGTLGGESIPDIAARVEGELLSAGSDTWKGRATVVARTETIAAYNGATNDAFHAVEETLDVPMEKIWLATEDSRTRHTHTAADGQRVPMSSAFTVGEASLEFPGDPTGPPQEVINCRCTMLLAEPGEAIDMSDRQLLASAHPAFVEPTTLGWALTAAGLPSDWAIVDGFDHSLCVLEFCRNGTYPGEKKVHPGPCRGWKHTLAKVAPGVYQALEQARVDKLNAKRKAKIKALKEAGKPVPKALLKPHVVGPPAGPPPPNLAEQGTGEPLSPATIAKVAKVSAKVKEEFDPETVALKKKLAKEKALALAEAEQAKIGNPPTVGGDGPKTPGGFVPTDEQDAAMVAAQQAHTMHPGLRHDAYMTLSADDFSELPAADKAAILADMAKVAHDPGLTPVEQAQLKAKFTALTGGPPPAPQMDVPTEAPAVPGVKTGPPPVDALAANAKAQQILANPAVIGKLKDYGKLSKDEFDALPPDTKAAVLADLTKIGNSNGVLAPSAAKQQYTRLTGEKMPDGEPPTPDASEPNKTAVPDAPSTNTPKAHNAVAAASGKNVHWKDRLALYQSLTQADVDSMSDDDIAAIEKDLTALGKWFQKKNLTSTAKGVSDALVAFHGKVAASKGIVDDPVNEAPDVPRAPATRPAKPAPPKGLKSTGKVLGSHGATVHEDENGKKWLVKKQAPMLAEVDQVTADLGKAAGVPTPEIHVMEVDGKTASVQEMIPGKDAFPGGKVKPADMTPAEVLAMQKQHVLDWLTANHDSHAGNFIKTEDGEIVGIDKGQALKWFGKDTLDPDWQPNEHPSAHGAMWKAFAAGEDINMHDPTSGELGDFIGAIEAMDDDEFKSMFRSYAEQAAAEGKLASAGKNPWGDPMGKATVPPNDVDAFLDALVKRKNSLSADFGALHQKMLAQRKANSDAEDIEVTKAPDLPTSGVDPAQMPPPVTHNTPIYTAWQKSTMDVVNSNASPNAKAYKAAQLTKDEYLELAPGDKAKVLDALIGADPDDGSIPAGVLTAYEIYTETPHPKAPHATSSTPAPTPAVDAVSLPKPAKDTFQEWQDAKKVIKEKKGYKGKAATVAKAISSGTVTQRLDAYTDIGDQQSFEALPDELQSAVIRDLDNIATAEGGFFTPTQQSLAGTLRQQLTGQGPMSPPSPTFGQPKKFQSQAAEKAYHIANNPGAHPVGTRLSAYNKLSASGFASLPPETQQKIAQDLTAMDQGDGDALDLSVTQLNQAATVHKKLTGVGPGWFSGAVKKPPKAAPKKKFPSKAAEDAWTEANKGTPISYGASDQEFHDKLAVYDQLSKEDFDALPPMTQKKIAKDLQVMAGGYKSPVKDEAGLVALKLLNTNYPGSWKPKSAAQKKAEAIAAMTPAEQAKLASDFSESADFKTKLAKAVTGEAALAIVPRSYVDSGSRAISGIPETNGITGLGMSHAVASYRGSGYLEINSRLRNAKGKADLLGSDSVSHKIRAIDAAMQHSVLPAPVQTNRGFSSSAAQKVFGSLLNASLAGLEFTEHGYASTSAGTTTANAFGNGGVVMRVLVPPGVRGLKLSGQEFESEILLERGLRYRIVADNGVSTNGTRRLDVEVVYP